MKQPRPGVRIEYRPGAKSDQFGRCEFTLLWEDTFTRREAGWVVGGDLDSKQRGQCFFADPRQYGFPRPEEAEHNG